MTMKIPEALDVLESLMSDRAASPDEEKGMKADVDEARKQWTDTHLSSKELATVLAALRYWQMDVLEIEGAKKAKRISRKSNL